MPLNNPKCEVCDNELLKYKDPETSKFVWLHPFENKDACTERDGVEATIPSESRVLFDKFQEKYEYQRTKDYIIELESRIKESDGVITILKENLSDLRLERLLFEVGRSISKSLKSFRKRITSLLSHHKLKSVVNDSEVVSVITSNNENFIDKHGNLIWITLIILWVLSAVMAIMTVMS